MTNSEQLQPGEVLAEYTLTQKLSKHKFFMSTWRATNGDDVVLNIYSTQTYDSDYAFTPHDLHPAIQTLLPTIEALKALPPLTGLAPLLDYHYTPDSPVLILVRKFYHERLEDRYIPGKTSQPDVLKITRQLATTFDALREHLPDVSFFITPEHLMLEDDQPIVLDYGLENLLRTIEYSYDGARPVTARWGYEMAWYPARFFKDGVIPAEYALASLYYYFRTGFGVFEYHDEERQGASERINWDALTRYHEQGTLPDMLENGTDEGQIVANALKNHYTSCNAIVDDLEQAG